MQSLFNYFSKRKLRSVIGKAEVIRLNVGAGGTLYTGWISIEKNELDITRAKEIENLFSPASIQAILAEHVIEHISRADFVAFLKNIKPFLKPEATIRIAVPDANHPSGYVRELTRPGGLEPGAEDHREFYDINQMRDIAGLCGYVIFPVEYFDERGEFISFLDGWENGYISRSSAEYRGRFTDDPQELHKFYEGLSDNHIQEFKRSGITYTSLIVDFMNPV